MSATAGVGEVKGEAAVAVWLAELGYTRLQSVFAGQNIDAASLAALPDTDLTELGISNPRDRAKLFTRAKAFLAQASSGKRAGQAPGPPPPSAMAPLAVPGAPPTIDPKAHGGMLMGQVQPSVSALIAHSAPPGAESALSAPAPVGKKPRGRPPLYASLVPLQNDGRLGGAAEDAAMDETAPDRNAKKRMQRAWRKAQRLHVCEVCGEAFGEPSSLKLHAAMHTDDAPFECKVCQKKFRRQKGLLAHEKTHSGP
jgi:hypothetical protein